jgi:hypothetical protein
MINDIFNNAKIIRAFTPYSFRLFFEKLEIFKPNSKKHKELYERFKPEFLLGMPIFPSELFFITYNKIVNCPDKNCQNFKNFKNLLSDIDYIENEVDKNNYENYNNHNNINPYPYLDSNINIDNKDILNNNNEYLMGSKEIKNKKISSNRNLIESNYRNFIYLFIY